MKQPAMVRNLIFDFDGTLVDSLPGIEFAVDAALSRLGRSRILSDLRPMIGPPVRSILQAAGGVTDEADLDRLEQFFRGTYDSEGWRKTECYPGVPEVLRGLCAGGRRLFLVTNKPLAVTHNILAMLALRPRFDDVVTRDSRTPPFTGKKEMLRDVVTRHGLQPGESLVVGDTEEDISAAESLGLPAAIVAHGYGSGRVALGFPQCRMIPDFRWLMPDSLDSEERS